MFAVVKINCSKELTVVPLRNIHNCSKTNLDKFKIYNIFISDDLEKVPVFNRKLKSNTFDSKQDAIYEGHVLNVFETSSDAINYINSNQRIIIPNRRLINSCSDLDSGDVTDFQKRKRKKTEDLEKKLISSRTNQQYLQHIVPYNVDDKKTANEPLGQTLSNSENLDETLSSTFDSMSSLSSSSKKSIIFMNCANNNFQSEQITIVSGRSDLDVESIGEIINVSDHVCNCGCLICKQKIDILLNEKLKFFIDGGKSNITNSATSSPSDAINTTSPSIYQTPANVIEKDGMWHMGADICLPASVGKLIFDHPKIARYDSRFIGDLLNVAFGSQTLRNSSIKGLKGKSSLDPNKLNIIREFYNDRIGGANDGPERRKKFNTYVNIKIQNLKSMHKQKSKKSPSQTKPK